MTDHNAPAADADLRPFDPLELAEHAVTATDAARQAARRRHRNVANIVSSYGGAVDVLAEPIQNALDELDRMVEEAPDQAARLRIRVNVRDNWVEVEDNGRGISYQDLQHFLAPDFSSKEHDFEQGRVRGHKGVGLTFLAYGFTRFELTTQRSGQRPVQVVLDGGRAWVSGTSDTTGPRAVPAHVEDGFPEGHGTRVRVHLGTDCTPAKAALAFRNLTYLEALVRTSTAAGRIGRQGEQLPPIELTLEFLRPDADNELVPETRAVPASYLYPWSADRPLDMNIVDLDDYDWEVVTSRNGATRQQPRNQDKAKAHAVHLRVGTAEMLDVLRITDDRQILDAFDEKEALRAMADHPAVAAAEALAKARIYAAADENCAPTDVDVQEVARAAREAALEDLVSEERVRFLNERRELREFLLSQKVSADVTWTYSTAFADKLEKGWNCRGTGLLKPGTRFVTAGMPTTIVEDLAVRSLATANGRAWMTYHFEGRVVLDTGRKALPPQVRRVIESTKDDLVRHVVQKGSEFLRPSKETTRAHVQDPKSSAKARLTKPWWVGGKQLGLLADPATEQDVLALFTMLIGSQVLGHLRPVLFSSSDTYDSVVEVSWDQNDVNDLLTRAGLGSSSDGSGRAPELKVTELKFKGQDVLQDLAAGHKVWEHIDLLVCWTVQDFQPRKSSLSITCTEVGSSQDRAFAGVTHHALVQGHGPAGPFMLARPVIALETLMARLGAARK